MKHNYPSLQVGRQLFVKKPGKISGYWIYCRYRIFYIFGRRFILLVERTTDEVILAWWAEKYQNQKIKRLNDRIF